MAELLLYGHIEKNEDSTVRSVHFNARTTYITIIKK